MQMWLSSDSKTLHTHWIKIQVGHHTKLWANSRVHNVIQWLYLEWKNMLTEMIKVYLEYNMSIIRSAEQFNSIQNHSPYVCMCTIRFYFKIHGWRLAKKKDTGRTSLIRSYSLPSFGFKLSGNSNDSMKLLLHSFMSDKAMRIFEKKIIKGEFRINRAWSMIDLHRNTAWIVKILNKILEKKI